MEINKTCLDCKFADFANSYCCWRDEAKMPFWVEVGLASSGGEISRERPYADCPAWEKETP